VPVSETCIRPNILLTRHVFVWPDGALTSEKWAVCVYVPSLPATQSHPASSARQVTDSEAELRPPISPISFLLLYRTIQVQSPAGYSGPSGASPDNDTRNIVDFIGSQGSGTMPDPDNEVRFLGYQWSLEERQLSRTNSLAGPF
jgi:hypothetical protein